MVLARELTKKFEEFRRGKPAVLLAAVKARPLKGEFVVLIGAEAAESKCEAVPLVEARDSGPAARQSQISNRQHRCRDGGRRSVCHRAPQSVKRHARPRGHPFGIQRAVGHGTEVNVLEPAGELHRQLGGGTLPLVNL